MDDRVSIHCQIVHPIQSRFERLNSILPNLSANAIDKKLQVPDAFEREDLAKIEELMQDYHFLTKRIRNLQTFLAKWQSSTL